MEEHVRAYARLRLERAKEEIDTARENIERGHYRAAASRAYYAIFYMASAALFTKDISRTKHSAIEAAFSQHIIKTGEIEPKYSRIYQMVRRQREEADYADEIALDEMTARQILEEAQSFVQRVETYLRHAGAL